MGGSCRCGNQISHEFHQLECIECGEPACPACAVPLESVTYCQGCADSLLGGTTVRAGGTFDLH
ncbi:MAG TPA: hypothetical protein VLF19_05080 [Methylomirabilota bacterium]|nr:hypothetical protein [Methylomirabilota bacterium]